LDLWFENTPSGNPAPCPRRIANVETGPFLIDIERLYNQGDQIWRIFASWASVLGTISEIAKVFGFLFSRNEL
jgi:hypothetical protein